MAGRSAWAAISAADLGVLLYGFLTLAMPVALAPGYESFTGCSWPDLVASKGLDSLDHVPEPLRSSLIEFRLRSRSRLDLQAGR